MPPSALREGADGVKSLQLEAGKTLTDAQRKAVVLANADAPVAVAAPGLRVVIPAGTLKSADQLAGLMVDPAPAKAGDVVVRTDAAGNQRAVPLSLVSDGEVAYVAAAGGNYALAHNEVDYADADDHWAREAIAFTSCRTLTQGMAPGRYEPEQPATRAMAITMLARLDDAQLRSAQGGNWYDGAVNWATARGLSDGQRAEDAVKREELAVLLWRWAGKPKAAELTGFTDLWEVDAYARPAMAWAVERGILRGRPDASLDPHAGATRAEIAVVFQRLITDTVEQRTR